MKSLADVRGLHAGKRIIVCGLGPSITQLKEDHGLITIGVNDIGRHFTPDHHFLQDRPDSFKDDRLDVILATKPKRHRYVSSAFEHLWKPHFDSFVRCGLHPISSYERLPGWDHGGQYLLHEGAGTPFVATSLAAFLGASEIGLVGVDMVDHPRLGPGNVPYWNLRFFKMVEWLAERDINLVNLSPTSAIDRVPFADWGLLHGQLRESSRTA